MTTITWLGGAALRIDTPDSARIYVDPWLTGPTTPEGEREPERMDLILITHAHRDHLGEAVELSQRFQAHIVAQTELTGWLSRNGAYLSDAAGMNKGGTVHHAGAEITMVGASHSSSLPSGEYGGTAVGYIIKTGGRSIYVAGDTDVFLDMQLIGELYQPDLAVLPIGDRMTMGPRQAAKAVELLGVTRVLPCHWDPAPALLTGRPQHLADLVGDGVEVLMVEQGETVEV